MIQFKNKSTTVFQSALFQTTTTVIQTPDIVLLVDPNWLPAEINQIKGYVEQMQKKRPLLMLFTHSDYDHIIGYRAFSHAKVIASERFVNNPKKESILQQIRDFDDANYIKRDYGITYPTVDYVISEDGQTLVFGDTSLVFYQAAGHNSDGLFTILPTQKTWITGDYFCAVEFPYIYHSSIVYEQTLAKTDPILDRFDIELLIPGHGKVQTKQEEIRALKAQSLRYIKTLRASLQAGHSFDFDRFIADYDFPKIMRSFHEGNVKLMKKELGLIG